MKETDHIQWPLNRGKQCCKIGFRSILFFFLMIFALLQLHSQDMRFSQFNASPLNINPALTGNFAEDFQLTANNRNQWAAITVPFTTTSFAFESKLYKFIKKESLKDKLKVHHAGLGLLVNRDKAGDSEFGTTSIALSLSYYFNLTSDESQVLAFGIQPAYSQHHINYNKLTFDSQYNSIQFLSSLPTNENLSTESYGYFDIAAGGLWAYKYSDKLKTRMGVALYHITQPGQTFYTDKSVNLYSKVVFSNRTSYTLNDNTELIPGFLFTTQNKQKEFTLGSDIRYQPSFVKNSENFNTAAVYGGAWLRYKDALILTTGFDFQKLFIGISYDVNVSKLVNASSGKGGFEIALIYRFNFTLPKEEENKNKKVPCPSFL